MNPYLLEILRHPIDKLAIVTWPDMLIVDANEEFCAHVRTKTGDNSWKWAADNKGRVTLSRYPIVWKAQISHRIHLHFLNDGARLCLIAGDFHHCLMLVRVKRQANGSNARNAIALKHSHQLALRCF